MRETSTCSRLWGRTDDDDVAWDECEDKGTPIEQEMEETHSDYEAEEGHTAIAATTPRQPSRRDIEEHGLTHVPFRSWCVHCKRGQAMNEAHKRKKQDEEEDENRPPIISLDYMFMDVKLSKKGTEEYETETKGLRPILVVTDSKSRIGFAHDMDEKGANDATIEALEDDIKKMGYQGYHIILKGDQ